MSQENHNKISSINITKELNIDCSRFFIGIKTKNSVTTLNLFNGFLNICIFSEFLDRISCGFKDQECNMASKSIWTYH